MPNYVIIGGSDAAISAALRIKELQPEASVQLFLKDHYPNYSICGIPFFISREVKDWHSLAHRTQTDIEAQGIELFLNETVQYINYKTKKVQTQRSEYSYDKVLIATGAISSRPDIKGINLNGVFTLRWIEDMLKVDHYLQQHHPVRALIVGGGYIGMEMADALHKRGLQVTVIESSQTVLKTMDPALGQLIEQELNTQGIHILHNQRVLEIKRNHNELLVLTNHNQTVTTDLVLLATGATPQTQLLREEGIALGIQGAYKVDRQMKTNLPDVYAAGDCTETWHALLEQPVYLPLGSTAHKQGRIAAENMVDRPHAFVGSFGTQVVKIFNLIAGRTGLHDRDAEQYGVPCFTVASENWDHKMYYPGATPLYIRVSGNPQTRQLLGLQIVGNHQAEVAKRIDIAATALYNRLTVDQLNELDLSYTPPLSTPWDPVQMAAQAWIQAWRKLESTRKVSAYR